MLRYTTKNSVYLLDDDGQRYRRSPLRERNAAALADQSASWRLADDEWLPMRDFQTEVGYDGAMLLRIFTPDAVLGVLTSPVVSVERVRESELTDAG